MCFAFEFWLNSGHRDVALYIEEACAILILIFLGINGYLRVLETSTRNRGIVLVLRDRSTIGWSSQSSNSVLALSFRLIEILEALDVHIVAERDMELFYRILRP